MPKSMPFEIEQGAISAVENAAIAAYEFVGFGDEIKADKAAIKAMHETITSMDIKGKIVFGEGDQFDSQFLYDGEIIGQGDEDYDIALDPLEGTTLAAKALQNALSVIAISPAGGLMHVPDVYMEKIAIGGGYPKGIVCLDNSAAQNVQNLADFKNCEPKNIGVCVLDRPRHAGLISDLREIGVRVYLIPDGDVAGCIFTTEQTCDIDMYMGIGGAPEGVLAAAALKCLDGQLEGRFHLRSDDDKRLIRNAGIEDLKAKFTIDDLVSKPVVFAACGITDGALLRGVHKRNIGYETDSILMNSQTKRVQKTTTLRLPER